MRFTSASLLCLILFSRSAVAIEPQPEKHFQEKVRPILVKYCGDCHDPEDPSNPVRFLNAQSIDDIAKQREWWRSVASQLLNRTMPPADDPQPAEQDRLELAIWIQETLRATACRHGDYAGEVMTRRLNGHEYDHTLRDLLGVDDEFSNTFPADGGGGEGFDNNGETLYLPVILMERYLEAAQLALDKAIITPPMNEKFSARKLVTGGGSIRDGQLALAGGQAASLLVSVYIEGTYDVTLQYAAKEPSQLVLNVDGIAAQKFSLASEKTSARAELHLMRGLHMLTLRITADAAPIGLKEVQIKERRDKPSAARLASHRLIFDGLPGENGADRDTARALLARFLRRAFRRSVTKDETERFLKLYDRAADRGDPFEERIKLALRAVLVSPEFLFRIEPPPVSHEIKPISDFALASRLSYFLWVSMPDDELLDLAEKGTLHEPATLRAQVDRMLASPKSRIFSGDFIGQWLGTREVGGRIAPDTSVFKNLFPPELSADVRRQPEEFLDYIIREDRSLLELIQSDYVIVNKRLADLYEISGVDGSEFRRVNDSTGRRGGILGLGGVHLVTSYPHRTSPVLRGAWVLETMLGTPVPSPPPDVPVLKDKRKKGEKFSLREVLLKHREAPACAACHNIIDPIGFGLENFDIIGRWREKENDVPIDASGVMPDGTKFNGPAELKQILLDRKQEFIRHLTGKMLGYALGRSLVDDDECTVEKIAADLEQHDYRARQLIMDIVLSTPFRNHQLVQAAPPKKEIPPKSKGEKGKKQPN
jgi:hypothetical protein